MWIHLLSLRLIDGANGEVPPPINADTHDGYFHKLWRKLKEESERGESQAIEQIEERIDEIEQEIEKVKSQPLPAAPVYIQSIPVPPIEAQAKLLEALILEVARLKREIEDEEDIEMLLLV